MVGPCQRSKVRPLKGQTTDQDQLVDLGATGGRGGPFTNRPKIHMDFYDERINPHGIVTI
jgi:hypothetical protein